MKKNLLKLSALTFFLTSLFVFIVAERNIDEQTSTLVLADQDQTFSFEASTCTDPLEQDHNDLLASAYINNSVECVFVGCGGIF